MHVLEAIRTRRSIFQFKPEPVPHERLVKALEAAIWAPNHHLSEPWRFTIIGEKTKEHLARRYAALQTAKLSERMTPAQRHEREEGYYNKFISKPTVICVSCIQDGDEVRRQEDFAAVCCAVQNVQLAAWADGIGMQWTTSAVTTDVSTYTLLGIDPSQERIIGFLYVGFPAQVPQTTRTPLEEVLRVIE